MKALLLGTAVVQALETRVEDAMHSTPRTCASTNKAIDAMVVRSGLALPCLRPSMRGFADTAGFRYVSVPACVHGMAAAWVADASQAATSQL